jgi:hypothetical protein
MSHKRVYYFESDELVPDTMAIFEKIFKGVKEKYQFVLHAPAAGPTVPVPAKIGVDASVESVKATPSKATKRSAKKAPTIRRKG